MKRNTYLTILSVVTALCVIGGSIYHLSHDIWFGDDNGWGLFSSRFSHLDHNNDSRVRNSISLEDFESIQINSRVLDITIQTGDTCQADYDCTERLVPDIKVQDHMLTITQSKVSTLGNNNHCTLTLTIPAGTKITKADIQCDVGDIQISGISADSLTGDIDTGECLIKDCSFDQIKLTADVGDIIVDDCHLGNSSGTIDANIGDINLTNCSFTNLAITNDTGDISLKKCPALSEYMLAFSTDIGDVTLNGKSQKKKFSQEGNDFSGTKKLTIENDCGDITVSEK